MIDCLLRLEELRKTHRMGFGLDIPCHRVDGLIDMITKLFPKDAVVAEVGSFAGVSTEAFALLCKDVYAIDPWDYYPEITDKDMLEGAEQRFNMRMQNYPNVHKIKERSLMAADRFNNKFFDAVYIDADHSYAMVKMDIETWLPKIRLGGFLTGHDYHQNDVHRAVTEMCGIPYMLFPDLSWAILIK